jgi:hypothetical protein
MLVSSIMGASLYILLLLILIFIGFTVMIAKSNRAEDTYDNLETDEWDCPECGFHIQAGDLCIYCSIRKKHV